MEERLPGKLAAILYAGLSAQCPARSRCHYAQLDLGLSQYLNSGWIGALFFLSRNVAINYYGRSERTGTWRSPSAAGSCLAGSVS